MWENTTIGAQVPLYRFDAVGCFRSHDENDGYKLLKITSDQLV